MAYTGSEYNRLRPSLVRGNRPRVPRADELIELALKRSRRRDVADLSFIRPFERLLEACNAEADLSALGIRALRVDVLRFLRNLLRFEEFEDACPSVLSRPIQAPVFITGVPRSGTTFLHRMILQDPSTIAPRLFQLVYPHASRTGAFETALRKRWVGLQLALFITLSPPLTSLHPVPFN